MKLLFPILMCASNLCFAQSSQYHAVDEKYGYKDIRFEMNADSLFKKVKAVKAKGSDKEFTSYDIADPKYLKVGECGLRSATVTAINNKVYSITLKTKAYGFHCIKDALDELFGSGFQSNEYIDRYAWIGETATIMLEEGPGSSGTVSLVSNIGARAFTEYRKTHARKSAKDF